MYKIDTIRKVLENAKTIGDAIRNDPAPLRVRVTAGNRKIGRVLNVSLMPVMACGNCKECKHYCYDIKACVQYANNVITARMTNFILATERRDEYFSQIDSILSRRRRNKYFRWHVAGDILDIDYFDRMVETARSHPDFIMWTYTKMYHIVNEWVRAHGGDRSAIPSNLTIMFSEWRGMPMLNPYGFPEFRVVMLDDETRPVGFYCPGNCDICKASGRGCIAGETVYCLEH